MPDSSLNVALRISARDAFSGVLGGLRRKISGLGSEANRVQGEYDKMFRHIAKGIAGIAAARYDFHKFLIPGITAAAQLQESLLSIKQILQGAHPDAKKLADEMARMRFNAVEVSNVMKYSARDIAEVQRQLIMSGVPQAAILDKITKAGRIISRGAAYYVEALAETQGTTPGETSKQIGNIGHALQLQPSQYGKLINLISMAGPTASGDLTQMFHVLENIGAISTYAGNTKPIELLAALKTVSPLGEQGGSDLALLLEAISGMRVRGRKYLEHAGLAGAFYTKQGQFIGLAKSIEKLQKIVAPMTKERENAIFGPIFGPSGLKAFALLMAHGPGVKSYAWILADILKQANLRQQRHVWGSGLIAQGNILGSTNQNTLAALFYPALHPITELTHWAGVQSAHLGAYATKNKGLAEGVTYGLGAVSGLAGLYGVYHLIKAIKPGSRVLRGLFGKLGHTAGGIAEGKAIQVATGVQPVFVVNMPGGSGSLPGDRGSALDTLIAGRRVRAARNMEGLAASTSRLSKVSRMASRSIGVLSAAAVGYAIGHEIYQHAVKGSTFERDIYAIMDAQGQLFHYGRGAMLARASEKGRRLNKGHLVRMNAARRVDVNIHVSRDGNVTVHKLTSSHPDVQASVGTALSTP